MKSPKAVTQTIFVYLFLQIVYKPSEEVRKLQKKMASLLKKQKEKGGIIDIEQERNRFLIDITSVCLKTKDFAKYIIKKFSIDTLSFSLFTNHETYNQDKYPITFNMPFSV